MCTNLESGVRGNVLEAWVVHALLPCGPIDEDDDTEGQDPQHWQDYSGQLLFGGCVGRAAGFLLRFRLFLVASLQLTHHSWLENK